MCSSPNLHSSSVYLADSSRSLALGHHSTLNIVSSWSRTLCHTSNYPVVVANISKTLFVSGKKKPRHYFYFVLWAVMKQFQEIALHQLCTHAVTSSPVCFIFLSKLSGYSVASHISVARSVGHCVPATELRTHDVSGILISVPILNQTLRE
jgi:hypothetical protein